MATIRLCILCLSFACGVAWATDIELVDQQFKTDLSYRYLTLVPNGHTYNHIWTSEGRSIESEDPISDEIRGGPRIFSNGLADTFRVSTHTSALWDISLNQASAYANASAKSQLTFRTLADETGSLSFNLALNGQTLFTGGMIDLYDMTANQSLLHYSWGRYQVDMGGPFAGFSCCESFSLAPQFLASHTYALTLSVNSDANTDSQSISLGVAGLSIASPAPEPQALAMMLVGLVGVVALARRKQATRAE